MSKQPSHERDQQIFDLLDGSLPDNEQAQLRAWLDESTEHYNRFVELSFLHSQLAEQLNSHRSADGVRLESLQAVPFEDETELPPIHLDATALTKQKYASALTYVLKHTFTPKRIAILSTAAAVLLGVVLAIVLLAGPDQKDQVVDASGNASDPGEPGRIVPTDPPAIAPIVASLTAEHDAVWDRRPGEDLFAGQTLQLIDGFAEITTTSGAIAVLQGPCTVEMTDSGSELRVRRGAMVGRCLTPQSKGFTVITPTARVTDLGTEFGVFIDARGSTLAEVFDGEVEVSTTGGAISARKLGAAESIAVDAGGQEIPRTELEGHPFAELAAMRAGIVEYSESIRVVPTRPSSLPYITGVGSDTYALVFPELNGQVLPAAAGVLIVEPGFYRDFPANVPPRGTVPAGTPVRSYVVRVRGESGPADITGRLVFDAPILGVMTDSGDWSAFVSHVPEHAIKLDGPVAQLLEGGENSFDRITVGQSARTLDFHLSVEKGTDHFRVFVAVLDEDQSEED